VTFRVTMNVEGRVNLTAKVASGVE
jgi:hypothetical protein